MLKNPETKTKGTFQVVSARRKETLECVQLESYTPWRKNEGQLGKALAGFGQLDPRIAKEKWCGGGAARPPIGFNEEEHWRTFLSSKAELRKSVPTPYPPPPLKHTHTHTHAQTFVWSFCGRRRKRTGGREKGGFPRWLMELNCDPSPVDASQPVNIQRHRVEGGAITVGVQ